MAIHIDLSDRTAWITGGASGIGAAIVAVFAASGARVVSLDRTYAEPGEHHWRGVTTVPVDLADAASIREAAERLTNAGLSPDILVNNAGITRDAPVWKLEDEDWTGVLDVNLTAAFRLVRAVAPAMRERRAGSIVNVASINGLRGKFGQANYSASKGGLIALTRTLARDLGPRGIRVNAVAPGMIETAMTAQLPADIRARAAAESALGRAGHPRHVADAVLFLASPLAEHITGHVLVVDGGQLA